MELVANKHALTDFNGLVLVVGQKFDTKPIQLVWISKFALSVNGRVWVSIKMNISKVSERVEFVAVEILSR